MWGGRELIKGERGTVRGVGGEEVRNGDVMDATLKWGFWGSPARRAGVCGLGEAGRIKPDLVWIRSSMIRVVRLLFVSEGGRLSLGLIVVIGRQLGCGFCVAATRRRREFGGRVRVGV